MQPEFNVSDNFFVVTIPNVNYQNDSIIDSINDLGLDILKYIKEKPGINAPTLTTLLTGKYPSITLYQVKNEIRRNLNNHIEHKGSKKTGGYHLKQLLKTSRNYLDVSCILSLEFNCSWRLRSNIVEYSVYSSDLIYDT